jgi:hypothetical protein
MRSTGIEESGGSIGIDQALVCFRVSGKLASRDHSFFQSLKFVPAFDRYPEVDIAGGAPWPEASRSVANLRLRCSVLSRAIQAMPFRK